MTVVIIILGALIFMAGISILINPELIFGFLRNSSEKIALQILAIVVRAGLGVLLIYQAHASRYPFVIELIGWLSIVSAAFLAVIGRHNFSRLMSWALSFVKPLGRIGGALAAAFGAFIIHAFL